MGGLLGVRSCGCGAGCPAEQIAALETALMEDALLGRWFPNCHTGIECSRGLEAAFGTNAACICESPRLMETYANNVRGILFVDPMHMLRDNFPDCDWPGLEDWLEAHTPEPATEQPPPAAAAVAAAPEEPAFLGILASMGWTMDDSADYSDFGGPGDAVEPGGQGGGGEGGG